ncbi:PQQ-dependent catabolism-associated beta-propeller protein [Bradyrhizobium sp. USDA 4369]
MSYWMMLMKLLYGAISPLTLRSPLKAGVSKGEARQGPHGSRRACGAPHHEGLQRAGLGKEKPYRRSFCPRPEEPAEGGRLEGRPGLRRCFGVAACLLTAALSLTSINPASAYVAFVSNEKGNTVSVIDTDTWTVTKTIKVGQRPRGIAFTRDGKFVMVAVGDDDTIQVIDAKKMEVVDTLPSGPDPELFAQDAAGKTLYVANENDNTVTVLDLEKRVRIGDVQVGVEPEGMMLSPDGKILICTSETTNMAHFIDTATRKIVANVLVDARPRYAEFKSDGSELWVSAEIGGTVSIIDPAKREVTGKIKFAVPGLRSEAIQPVGIGLTKDGKTGFVALGPANRVAVVDGSTHEVKKYLLVGQRVWHMEFTPDEKYLVVTNGVSNDVSVIDVAAQKVIKTIQVGELPWGITIAQP